MKRNKSTSYEAIDKLKNRMSNLSNISIEHGTSERGKKL